MAPGLSAGLSYYTTNREQARSHGDQVGAETLALPQTPPKTAHPAQRLDIAQELYVPQRGTFDDTQSGYAIFGSWEVEVDAEKRHQGYVEDNDHSGSVEVMSGASSQASTTSNGVSTLEDARSPPRQATAQQYCRVRQYQDCHAEHDSAVLHNDPVASVTEDERAGQWFLVKMKEDMEKLMLAKHTRRMIAAKYEHEVKKRNALVNAKNTDIEDAMQGLKNGLGSLMANTA